MYKERVTWSQEEEVILLEAMANEKRVNIEMLFLQNPILIGKTNKQISNKIASLKKKPTIYSPRSKWSDEEIEILVGIITQSFANNLKISHKELSKIPELNGKTSTCLKNKLYALKTELKLSQVSS